ncbi:hypothetical protein H6G80_30110 [Nostoc sp. FACHB-87]|uniref:relaxase/mobilization nuclease domain-containing protein n=1 Tax=Nostocales TaxID=1161 RepID=UPI001683620F|nr:MULTISPECIES: hypothetical protein [Nostocales]MBD2303269.1 hypothetical protein [Nostoc sp. FACHB-190]MBD2458309.1 hypothetical protein [Nostoc sp. FACHB-87]MBD2479457.1 hypothetical protein [Anabaena sp. FACHB-83]MBD2491248.1 hypothetical protein [Aulosira sp. FACHB-615]
MRMVINESTINNFNIITELAKTKNPCLGNLIDINSSHLQIIANFNFLSSQRPKLKKLGIYCLISLNNTPTILLENNCQQILLEYIKEIGWNDLQYVGFVENSGRYARFHLIFNRVTIDGNLIDLNCLGATVEQYDILRKAINNSQVVSHKSQLRRFNFTRISDFRSVVL